MTLAAATALVSSGRLEYIISQCFVVKFPRHFPRHFPPDQHAFRILYAVVKGKRIVLGLHQFRAGFSFRFTIYNGRLGYSRTSFGRRLARLQEGRCLERHRERHCERRSDGV